MLKWTIEQITLDLKYTWKISRNASDQKTNLIIKVTDGINNGKGEAAPNIRYNESADDGLAAFERFEKTNPGSINTLEDLLTKIKSADVFNSLSFAIESAWFAYESERTGKSFYELTGLTQPGEITTSYTIPIMETGKLKSFFADNRLERFSYIKLKVNNENALESLLHLLSFCSNPIMVDANESFNDVEECIRWIEKIKKLPIVLIEQPLPAKMIEESIYLKKYCSFQLFGDESMTDDADFSQLKKSFDGVNMKLMKAGGYQNGIRLLKEARKNNMKTMIGCMVETTLGISAAMRLCSLVDYVDLDSFLLIRDEPFGLIKEHDGELRFKNKKQTQRHGDTEGHRENIQ